MSACNSGNGFMNNYGGGYATMVPNQSNGGGYYNSYNADIVNKVGANNPGCYFPAPPPKRVYCSPAPFTNPLGLSHSRLLDAYGASRAHY